MQGIVGGRWLWRPARVRQMTALLMLGGLAAAILAGCMPPLLTNATPTVSSASSLHFLLDMNSHSVGGGTGLQYSVVATDIHDGHVAWKHQLEMPASDTTNSVLAPPVLANGLVYVGYYSSPASETRHSALAALDVTTGKLRWRHDVDTAHQTEIQGQPVISGSTVYLSVDIIQGQGAQPPETGLVQALDSQTGTLRWQKKLPDVPTMAAVTNGRLFIMTNQSYSGHLLALSAQDGSILWNYAADAPITRGGDAENAWTSAPVVSGHLVYPQVVERFSDGGADMFQLAVNMSDGHLVWKYETKGIVGTPAINQSGNTICVGTYLYSDSSIAGLDTSTGHERWKMSLPGIASGCTAAGSAFYLSDGAADSSPGGILALNSRDGHQLWKATVGTPVDADGALVPSVSGSLVTAYLDAPLSPTNGVMAAIAVMRASDGTLVWKHTFGGRPDKVMDIEGDQIYNPEYVKLTPIITAYSLTTGAKLWSYTFGNA